MDAEIKKQGLLPPIYSGKRSVFNNTADPCCQLPILVSVAQQTDGACVCACEGACARDFLNDLSGCSGAISGSVSQTGNCRSSLFTLHIHPHTQGHTSSLCGSCKAQAPRQALGCVITGRFGFPLPISPPAPSPPPLQFSLSIRLPAALETR